jgi:hypothetical protein
VTLENGEHVREIRLHYREADQNREFRLATLPGGAERSTFQIDASDLDHAYELLAYFEIIDTFGRGFFHPDPLEQSRYYIIGPKTDSEG